MTEVREDVRERYAEAARSVSDGRQGSCCDATCCGGSSEVEAPAFGSLLYDQTERGDLPEEALLASLGCGNPTAVAELRPGEVVLDLGSGGGIDVFLSAKHVGPDGKAYGLDMTDEMLELARSNQKEAGIENVEFLKGYIEAVNPGAGDSFPAELTNIGGTVFFSADDGSSGVELWKSRGTAATTRRVKDIRPGDSTPVGLTNVGGTLFFQATDGNSGYELWRSRGTAATTRRVKDINRGAGDSEPLELANVGGTLFFQANDGSSGYELWRSRGTAASTRRIKDISPGPGDAVPSEFTDMGGTLLFYADDGSSGFELWRSRGTAATTRRVKDINPGVGASFPADLTIADGTLFFRASDGNSGFELWRSRGTAATTRRVKDINPAGARAPNSSPRWAAPCSFMLTMAVPDQSCGGVAGPRPRPGE